MAPRKTNVNKRTKAKAKKAMTTKQMKGLDNSTRILSGGGTSTHMLSDDIRTVSGADDNSSTDPAMNGNLSLHSAHTSHGLHEQTSDPTNASPAAQSTVQGPSRLLDIAPELRNRITALAVTSSKPITVSPTSGFQESGLLLACKSLRTEAAPVFYSDNTFHLDQVDHNSDFLVKWQEKSLAVQKEWEVTPAILPLDPMQTPSWPNVLIWVERIVKGEVSVGFEKGRQEDLPTNVEARVQRLALTLLFGTAKDKRDTGEAWKKEREMCHTMLTMSNVLWT